MNIDREELVRLTEEHGGAWGINHVRRLLELIALIGQGMDYNTDAVWIAAHLHDWGAYPAWAKEGVDHAVRSREIAGPFLRERGCSEEMIALISEIIETHHSTDPQRSLEAILLSDADALDFLGVVGVLRIFSKNTKDLRKAHEITRKRQKALPGGVILERAKEIAAVRARQMDEMLNLFESDSFGCY